MSDIWLGLTGTQWTAIGVIATIIIGVATIYLYLRKQKEKKWEKKRTTSQKDRKPKRGTGERPVETQKIKKPLPQTFFDSFVVDTGTFYKIVLPLKAGQKVKGIAEEASGYEFDFYIMDEEEYSHFVADDNFEPLFESEDKPVARFNVRIPESDDWYLVFQVYAKRTSREIELKYTVFPQRGG